MCAVLQVVRGEREGGKCADEAVTRKEWRQRRGIRRRQQKRGQRRILQGGNRKGRVLQISFSRVGAVFGIILMSIVFFVSSLVSFDTVVGLF